MPGDACTLGTEGTFGPDRIVKTTYDDAGQAILVQTGYGTAAQADEVATAYSDNGRVAHLTDGEGNRTTYGYDGHDRLVRTIYPSPTTDGVSNTADDENLTLDANGNVTSRELRDGNVIGYTFDALNRMTAKDLPNIVTGEFDQTFGYDLLGRMVSASDTNSVNLSFTYDALGRLLSEGDNYHGTRTSQYDAAGRRTRLTWKDGFYVTYDHLVTGEVTAIRENGATSGVGVLATFGYDDLGRRTSLSRGNGTVTSYAHDPVGRLARSGAFVAPG